MTHNAICGKPNVHNDNSFHPNLLDLLYFFGPWQAMDDVEHEWLRLVSVIIFLVPVLFKLNSESKQLRLYSFIIAQILIISPTFFT